MEFILLEVNKDGNPVFEEDFLKNKKKGEFFTNEYAIIEKYQIFPIYSLTLKRNEYFILWRDPNFFVENKFSDYLSL